MRSSEGNTRAFRFRALTEQALSVSVHEHAVPKTLMNFFELKKPDSEVGTVDYVFDGSGAYYCRMCMHLFYGWAHHCHQCSPSYDICTACFHKQKTLDIGTRRVVFENKSAAEYHDNADEDDPFGRFADAPELQIPTSTAVLHETKRHDFRRLLDILFPKQSQEDLAAEAQGRHRLKVDYSLRDERTGRMMLHFACEAGNDKVVLGLLMHVKSSVRDSRDYDGLTPLMIASMMGKAAVVEELLYGHADTSLKCDKGYTALMLAVCYGWADITSRLLFSGARVNDVSDETGRTALSIAALNGSTACVQRLLQCDDIDRTIEDHEGYTSLFLAASMGYQEIVELFPEEDRLLLHW